MKTPMNMSEEIENLPPGLYEGMEARNGGVPTKCGPVWLLQPGPGGRPRRTRVRLSVYTSNFDRYAVVSMEKLFCKDCGFINLKNATVREIQDRQPAQERFQPQMETLQSRLSPPPSPNRRLQQRQQTQPSGQFSFQIVPRHCDGNVLTLTVTSRAELDDWLRALDADLDTSPQRKEALTPPGTTPKRLPLSPRSNRLVMPILEEEGNEE